MNRIQIGVIGTIMSGDGVGRFVQVIDDSDNTGGFLILTSDHRDLSHGYDDWVENTDALTRYFDQSQWVVDWALSS